MSSPARPAAATLSSEIAVRRGRALTISKGWVASFSHRIPTAHGDRWCGHNCDIRVELIGPPDPLGMVWDYGALGPAKRLFEQVDHRHLDDLLPGLPAPCGDLLQLLGDYLQDQLTAQGDLAFAHLVGNVRVVDAWPAPDAPAWRSTRAMRFHAHHRLDGLPDGHKCRRDHGHGYQWGVEIDPAATGTPGAALEPAVAFVRRELHQRSLNEVLGSNPTAEYLAAVLGTQFVDQLQIPGIVRVVVAETPTTTAEWSPGGAATMTAPAGVASVPSPAGGAPGEGGCSG
jgi:6-pyruvoyltetrahydropterin/6-carboxytetrahydropterin synthase